MEMYDVAKDAAWRVAQVLAERGTGAAERAATAWRTHKPTTPLGWTVRTGIIAMGLRRGRAQTERGHYRQRLDNSVRQRLAKREVPCSSPDGHQSGWGLVEHEGLERL